MGSDRPLAVAPDSTNSLGSLCPSLWGATRRESNIVTVFPKDQTEEVTRGERSNTAVNKMKKRIWGKDSTEAAEKVGRVRTLKLVPARENPGAAVPHPMF